MHENEMNTPPQTRISLINTIANHPESARWTEFCRAYEQPMRAYLASHFPTIEADDIIQETMVALMKALPNYRYDPDRKGHFRNYLIGIIRHKAVSEIRRRKAESDRINRLAAEGADRSGDDTDGESLRTDIFEAAVAQLMADDQLASRTREIFRHVVLLHEKPEQVAADFGVTRNNVDQIKKRLVDRLREMVLSMSRQLSSP